MLGEGFVGDAGVEEKEREVVVEDGAGGGEGDAKRCSGGDGSLQTVDEMGRGILVQQQLLRARLRRWWWKRLG